MNGGKKEKKRWEEFVTKQNRDKERKDERERKCRKKAKKVSKGKSAGRQEKKYE